MAFTNPELKALISEVEAEAGTRMRVMLLAALAKHAPEAEEPEADADYVLMKLALVKDAVRDEHTATLKEMFRLECTRARMVATPMSHALLHHCTDADDAVGDDASSSGDTTLINDDDDDDDDTLDGEEMLEDTAEEDPTSSDEGEEEDTASKEDEKDDSDTESTASSDVSCCVIVTVSFAVGAAVAALVTLGLTTLGYVHCL